MVNHFLHGAIKEKIFLENTHFCQDTQKVLIFTFKFEFDYYCAEFCVFNTEFCTEFGYLIFFFQFYFIIKMGEISSDNVRGLILALSSSIFIGSSFIIKKKGLMKAGVSGIRAGFIYLIFLFFLE